MEGNTSLGTGSGRSYKEGLWCSWSMPILYLTTEMIPPNWIEQRHRLRRQRIGWRRLHLLPSTDWSAYHFQLAWEVEWHAQPFESDTGNGNVLGWDRGFSSAITLGQQGMSRYRCSRGLEGMDQYVWRLECSFDESCSRLRCYITRQPPTGCHVGQLHGEHLFRQSTITTW